MKITYTGRRIVLAPAQTVELEEEFAKLKKLLDTANGSGGTILTGEEINAAPLNGRQVYMLLGTTPGSQFTVDTFGPGKNSGTRGWDVANNYILGGGVQGQQQFTLNGTNITLQNNGKAGTWQIAPNADAPH